MSQYMVLSHIDIQNANSIAGLTWGFPAVTNFLGFTHALNRKLSNSYDGQYDLDLIGCAVISHSFYNKVYQSKQNADFEFLQSKNPPVLAKHKGSSPPIIEEGKMNLSVSLVIELEQSLLLSAGEIKQFEKDVLDICFGLRLAGGSILNIKRAKVISASTEVQHIEMLRKIKKLTLPGFVLLERSNYLNDHYQVLLTTHKEMNNDQDEPQLFDAWLDFSALKFKAIPQLDNDQTQPDENTRANWTYIAKPYSGYLVPLMTGYKAISELYAPEEVLSTRDEVTPCCFVESIHSVGEWKGVHNIKKIKDTIWRYKQEGQWYLCRQTSHLPSNNNEPNLKSEEIKTLNFNDALNLF
ncbi:type I-F CRISPR-associated protein Csy2 [Aliivibrio kagoshimensis]|uniref:type I-F CRISPR-associated protein Csy2 n=1 Tax=Aliivibrio kagoshimensis TaxID=2910230 RepID=UPI003D0985B0